MTNFETAYEDLKGGEGLKVWKINVHKYQDFYTKLFGNDINWISNCQRIVEFMTIEEQYAVGLINDADIIEEYESQMEIDRSSIRDNQ